MDTKTYMILVFNSNGFGDKAAIGSGRISVLQKAECAEVVWDYHRRVEQNERDIPVEQLTEAEAAKELECWGYDALGINKFMDDLSRDMCSLPLLMQSDISFFIKQVEADIHPFARWLGCVGKVSLTDVERALDMMSGFTYSSSDRRVEDKRLWCLSRLYDKRSLNADGTICWAWLDTQFAD